MSLKITDSPSDNRPDTGSIAPATSKQSLGDQLRQAREARGLSLRHVSDQTRISMRYLESIEADNFNQLPGGIFNRSFVKAYAKQVGFDEQTAMDLYSRITREQGETTDEAPISYSPQVYTNGDSSRSSTLTFVLSIVILAILCYGVYAALHWFQKRNGAAPAATVESTTNAPNVNSLAPNNDLTQNNSAIDTSAAISPNDQINVRVSATTEEVALSVKIDDGRAQTFLVRPGDPAREFTAQDQLVLRYARARADALAVQINNRPANVPINPAVSTNEMLITRETFGQQTQATQ